MVLTGRPGGTTHLSVEALAQLPPEMRLIGGLAVVCRVGVPHRATVDLDALTRNLELFDPTLQRLALSSSGGGQYVMPGRLDLDVIDVAPGSADQVLAELVGTRGAAVGPRAQRGRPHLGTRHRHVRGHQRRGRRRNPADLRTSRGWSPPPQGWWR